MITSLKNNIVKQILKLHSKKEREKLNLAIIEGERFISLIPKDIEVSYYVFSESYARKINVMDTYKNCPAYILKEDIFKKISQTVTPQGIMAICGIKEYSFEQLKIEDNSLFVLLDRITEPGNLGSIIRTADALGVSAIIMSKGCVDLYNDKCLRTTMGSLFNIPIIKNSNMEEIIHYLKNQNFNIVCTHLDGKDTPFQIDFLKKTAIIIGNEANGVLEKYLDLSNQIVKIPMIGKAESMNVSIASSILFYEAIRQKLN